MSKHAPAVKQGRSTFASGKLPRAREPRPCSHGHHAGPFDRDVTMDRGMSELTMELGLFGATFVYYKCRRCGEYLDVTRSREVAA